MGFSGFDVTAKITYLSPELVFAYSWHGPLQFFNVALVFQGSSYLISWQLGAQFQIYRELEDYSKLFGTQTRILGRSIWFAWPLSMMNLLFFFWGDLPRILPWQITTKNHHLGNHQRSNSMGSTREVFWWFILGEFVVLLMKEILRSPLEVGSFSRYEFFTSQVVLAGFLNHPTVPSVLVFGESGTRRFWPFPLKELGITGCRGWTFFFRQLEMWDNLLW